MGNTPSWNGDGYTLLANVDGVHAATDFCWCRDTFGGAHLSSETDHGVCCESNTLNDDNLGEENPWLGVTDVIVSVRSERYS